MRCEDLNALAAWAEDEGGLLDEVRWLAVEATPDAKWRLVLATPLAGEPPVDPRDRFRALTEPALRWTLAPLGGATAPPEGARLPAEVGGLWPLEGSVAGLAVDVGSAVFEIAAEAWEAEVGGPLELPVVRAPDPLEITWHGPGPVAAAAVRGALAALGQAVELYGNWAGSGQRMGSAFVKDVLAPRLAAADEQLGGAWRAVPTGAAAEDPRGVWLAGQSLATFAYVAVQRTEASDPALVAALCAALDGLAGLAWAHSGNALVEGAEGLTAWCRLLPRTLNQNSLRSVLIGS